MKDKIIGCLILFVVGASIVTGAYFAGMSFGRKHSEFRMPSKKQIADMKERESVTIFVPSDEEGEINVAPKKYKTDETSKKDRLTQSMDILVKDLVFQKVLPKGTQLVSDVKKDGDVAVVDLSSEVKDFSGGSSEESQIINSLAYTAIKNGEGIKYVQILVDGKKIESLGGHFELEDPYSPEKEVPEGP